eukprot:TRINITY_DN14438_c0_g1_i1.p1 TRINITY_DN14438_c0_g1~~TRINITY_DN14438_c0_g1_i1.p1  ORF type:complete len:631 (-),score=44.14 TRINITY_DN14438_c0_g1_i1:141-1985(-)
MSGGASFVVCGSALICVASTCVLYNYAQKEVSALSFLTSLVGFVLSLIIIALVPYDVAEALEAHHAHIDNKEPSAQVLVGSSWELIYWVTFILCWVLCPLLIEWEAAGDFTCTGRFRASLKKNTAWCVWYIFCAIVLLIWLTLGGAGEHGSLGAWCIAASNAWGLLVSTVLMGYGLVAVPSYLWNLANPSAKLRELYCVVVSMDEARLSTQFELQDVISEARAETANRSSQIWDPRIEMAFGSMQMTLEECELLHCELTNGQPTPLASSSRSSCGPFGQADVVQDVARMEYLVQLHRALRQASLEARRASCRWDELLKECLDLEDLEEHTYPSQVELVSAWNSSILRPLCNCSVLRIGYHQMYRCWLATLRPNVLRIAALVCGFLSTVIVLGQMTMFSDSWSLSMLSLMFTGDYLGFGVTQVLCTLPLGYMVCTAYWSVFRLKIAGWYGLYPNHNTDTGSLLWCASVLARLAAPLCYHFLLLIRVKGTSFQAMMGQMNVVPVLGKSFNEVFPIIIAFLVLCNLLNVYSKIVQVCGLHSLDFERTPVGTERGDLIQEGRRLIERERRKRSEDRSMQLELNDRSLENSRSIPLRLQIASLIEDGTLPADWNASSPN